VPAGGEPDEVGSECCGVVGNRSNAGEQVGVAGDDRRGWKRRRADALGRIGRNVLEPRGCRWNCSAKPASVVAVSSPSAASAETTSGSVRAAPMVAASDGDPESQVAGGVISARDATRPG